MPQQVSQYWACREILRSNSDYEALLLLMGVSGQPTLRMRLQDPVLPPAVLNREAARWAVELRTSELRNMPN